MARYSMEQHYNIFNDDTGEKIVVRPDRDGLNLIEIVTYDDEDKEYSNITLTKDQVRLVVQALSQIVDQIED